MQQQFIDGVELHRLFTAGYRSLKNNMQAVNDLNVFPVPDGDTGTNMVQTFGGGLMSTPDNIQNVGEYMSRLSGAVLLSARGNSGVIFSQFIYGLSRGFEGKERIAFSDLRAAFACAVEDAYGAIVTPTEGTILTVIRETADYLKENADNYSGFEDGLKAVVDKMKLSLANTPNLLPVLKEANVVDSGGAGLLCFIEGMYAHTCGKVIEDTEDIIPAVLTSTADFGPDSVLEYGYCTEFVLQLMNYKTDVLQFNINSLTEQLSEIGNSIVAVHNGGIVKIHVHTFTPEKALELGRKYGEFISVKIENMSLQHSEATQQRQKEKVKYAIIAVASGQGIIDYFYSIGANAVIDGGQTNNPSVNTFLDAFDNFEAEHIVVLPNNSNIIFTANQAAEMYKNTPVTVIPTKSIVEGYSALSMMNTWCDTVDELISDMTSGFENATTAYVTQAIRDAKMSGEDVKKGEYIGLEDKTLIARSDDRVKTAVKLVENICKQREKDVIIVFTGDGVTADEASYLEAELTEIYPIADIGFIEGKLLVYDFIIALE